MEHNDSFTSVSLLMRIHADDRDADAWREFVERYGKRVFGWCLNRGCSPDDAEEVTQEVLLKLAKRLGSFEYDESRSFRGWLRRVTENALIDFSRDDQTHTKTATGEAIHEMLSDLQAREDLQSALEGAFDLELFDHALNRVRNRVSSERFQAWTRTAREGQSASDVAGQLNMKIATVYSARHYVQSLITEEVQLLESNTDKAGVAGHDE